METNNYKGWLNSDNFFKRAFAVLGYNTVASLIIAIPFYIILFGMMFAFYSQIPDSEKEIMGKMMDQMEEAR